MVHNLGCARFSEFGVFSNQYGMNTSMTIL